MESRLKSAHIDDTDRKICCYWGHFRGAPVPNKPNFDNLKRFELAMSLRADASAPGSAEV